MLSLVPRRMSERWCMTDAWLSLCESTCSLNKRALQSITKYTNTYIVKIDAYAVNFLLGQ